VFFTSELFGNAPLKAAPSAVVFSEATHVGYVHRSRHTALCFRRHYPVLLLTFIRKAARSLDFVFALTYNTGTSLLDSPIQMPGRCHLLDEAPVKWKSCTE
jgi:hypothetical protein